MGETSKQAMSHRTVARTIERRWLECIGVWLGVSLSAPAYALVEELAPVVVTGSRESGHIWDRPGVIVREASGGTTRRYTVNVHYMYNTKTGALDDFKLVNKLEDGCTGKVEGI